MEARSLKPLKLTGNVSENWRLWKQKFDIYSTVLELNNKPEQIQCAHLLFQMGEEVIDIFNSFTFTDDEKNKIGKLKEKFDNHFIPKRNLTYERYKFFTARQFSEPIDAFVSSLKSQAQECDFPDNGFKTELIMTMLIVGIKDEKLRQHLLHQEYSLEKAIEVCSLAQCSKEQQNELSPPKSNESDDDNSNLKTSTEKLVTKELNITRCDTTDNMGLQNIKKNQLCRSKSIEFQFSNSDKDCRLSQVNRMGLPLSMASRFKSELCLKQNSDKQQIKVRNTHDNSVEEDRFRFDATFRFSVQINKLKGFVRSPPHYVRNLPWIIEVRKPKRGRYLKISLQCNRASHSTSWACYAAVEVRLMPIRINKRFIYENVQTWFNHKDYFYNFHEDVEWDELLDENSGYLFNDTITIEVYLRANEPRGFH